MALRAVSSSAASGLVSIATGFANAPLTGTTTETALASVLIPGGSMGPNGALRITANYTYPNNANTKTMTVRIGAQNSVTSSLVFTANGTTTVAYQFSTIVRNAGVTNSQVVFNGGAGSGTTGSANITAAIDTTQNFWVNFTGVLASAADTLTLIGYTVEILHG